MDLDFASLVIAAATAELDDEPAARAHADALEFRMDMASDPLDALCDYEGDLPVIATNRIEREGGNAPKGMARLDALAEAAEHAAVAAIDVELVTVADGDSEGEKLLAHARDHSARAIVSVHDFERTPRARLSELLGRTSEYGDVGKVAVTAQDPGDVLALLQATHEFVAADTPVATMAMGEVGRHSRVVAPLYGSRIAYAPVDPARATAPGQYYLATLAGLIDRLE